MINPFRSLIGEDQDIDSINELFVSDYSCTDTFISRYHTFLWGTRGTGKSILLRYFEPKCQIKRFLNWKEYLKSESPFLGVYLKLDEGLVNHGNFFKMDSYLRRTISIHLLIILTCEKLITTLIEQIPSSGINEQVKSIFIDKVIEMLFLSESDTVKIDKYINKEKEPLNWVLEYFKKEKRKIMNYLVNYYIEKSDANFNGNISDYHTFLLPFIKLVKELYNIEIPVYLMFDDVGYLHDFQQEILNSWIAVRNHADICIKATSEVLDYKTFCTVNGSLIERVHDYTEVTLDYRYTNEINKFEKHIYNISNLRLEAFCKQNPSFKIQDIKELLVENEKQNLAIKNIQEILYKEAQQNHDILDKKRYINRYTMPRLHQNCSRSYAGFSNIVNISSGNTRDFLLLCQHMFSQQLHSFEEENGIEEQLKKLKTINCRIQDAVVSKVSKNFLLGINEQKLKEDKEIIEKLSIFITNLLKLMSIRLKNPKVKEPSANSFIINNQLQLSELNKKVLRAGIRYRYIKRSTYSSKSLGGRQDVFILSALLFPEFQLNTSENGGRISFTCQEIQMAMNDLDVFIKQRWENQSGSDQMNLFEENDELICEEGDEFANEYSRLY